MTNSKCILNIEGMTPVAIIGLIRLDKTFVGTKHYMGLAYFWAHEYRHYLRDASIAVRAAVHKAFLQKGLDPAGESPQHEAIILKYCQK